MNKTSISNACSARPSWAAQQCRAMTIRMLIMTKLTLFFILLFSLGAWANVRAQKVNITAEHLTFRKAVEQIQEQTNLSFAIKEKHMRAAKPVSLFLKDVEPEDALKALFSDQPFAYKLEGAMVTTEDLKKSGKKREHTIEMKQFEDPVNNVWVIEGLVLDADTREPVSNVTVSLEKHKIETVTDDNGRFRIVLPIS